MHSEQGSSFNEIVAPNVTEDQGAQADPWMLAGHIVKDWESSHGRLHGRTRDLALKTAYCQVAKRRGITRRDLQDWYGLTVHYARRKLYLLQEKRLFVPLPARRSGKLKQYCISTELDKFDSSFGSPAERARAEAEQTGTFIQRLAAILSKRQPTFHKLSLYTQIFESSYKALGWTIIDPANQSKVREFRLEQRRTVKFTVSPNGTAVIYMESTANPYQLHTPEGLVDFFAALGEARSILRAECGSNLSVPAVKSWKLKLYDMDKTIPMSELAPSDANLLRWWSDEGITVEYLGYAFQIYGKVLPELGEALRFENNVTVSPDKVVAEGIIEAINPAIKYESAFKLLQERVGKLERGAGQLG